MMDPEQVRKAHVRESALTTMGLFVLLDRNGGRVRFTRAEYEATAAKYGGSSRIAMHFEVASERGEELVELTLINKPPANAELPA